MSDNSRFIRSNNEFDLSTHREAWQSSTEIVGAALRCGRSTTISELEHLIAKRLSNEVELGLLPESTCCEGCEDVVVGEEDGSQEASPGSAPHELSSDSEPPCWPARYQAIMTCLALMYVQCTDALWPPRSRGLTKMLFWFDSLEDAALRKYLLSAMNLARECGAVTSEALIVMHQVEPPGGFLVLNVKKLAELVARGIEEEALRQNMCPDDLAAKLYRPQLLDS